MTGIKGAKSKWNRVQIPERGIHAGKQDGIFYGGVDRPHNRRQNFIETSERLRPCASATAPFCDNRGAKQLIPVECVRRDAPGTSEYLTKEVSHAAIDITQYG